MPLTCWGSSRMSEVHQSRLKIGDRIAWVGAERPDRRSFSDCHTC
jgi:hypothetical protein